MFLELKHSDKSLLKPSAIFIRGDKLEIWFQQLYFLNLDITLVEFYVIPQSINSIDPAGLLVLFKNPELIDFTDYLDVYANASNKLLIPIHASLYPSISEEELNKLLAYDLNFFHPTLGMVGFDKSDQIFLSDFIDVNTFNKLSWNNAHAGIPALKALKHIEFEKLIEENVIQAIKDSIDTKPLDEIPDQEKHTSEDKFSDPIKIGLLKFFLFFVKMIPAVPSASKSGLLNHFENWLNRNLDEIAKSRNKELNRLLKMFEENMNEALQYAIPLDSPYLNRGSDTPQDKLTRGNTDFTLSRLGGGAKTDFWDVSSYYDDLKKKYNDAAKIEIDRKNFKKAAYIYAHLLGDYFAAAKVLEDGEFYKEAASLYKDHLKNISSAAICYEKGGFTLDAIFLYEQLHKHEKIGDLYGQIEQQDKAKIFYEKALDINIKASDFIDAARIADVKLGQTETAKNLLVEGWQKSSQDEKCLFFYFGMISKDGQQNLSKSISTIYRTKTTKSQRTKFLNVLSQVIEKQKDSEILHQTQELTYEIVSEQSKTGDLSAIYFLHKFFPADKLLSSDANRFIKNAQTFKRNNVSTSVIQLDPSIQWMMAVSHRNQFLVLGSKNSYLQLARCNWYGNIEYHSWNDFIKTNHFQFVCEPYVTNQIVLHSIHRSLMGKVLSSNKYFDETIIIESPAWLNSKFLAATFKKNDCIAALKLVNESLVVYEFTNLGKLIKTTDCSVFHNPIEWSNDRLKVFSEMFYREGKLFTYFGKNVLTIAESGKTHSFSIGTDIELMTISNDFNQLYIVILINGGFVILHQESEFMLNEIYFENHIKATDIKFLSANRFVVSFSDQAIIYEIVDNSVKSIAAQKTFNKILGVLPTSFRNKCGILEDSGKITVYNIEN